MTTYKDTSWVPVVSDSHSLWEEIAAASPPPPPRQRHGHSSRGSARSTGGRPPEQQSQRSPASPSPTKLSRDERRERMERLRARTEHDAKPASSKQQQNREDPGSKDADEKKAGQKDARPDTRTPQAPRVGKTAALGSESESPSRRGRSPARSPIRHHKGGRSQRPTSSPAGSYRKTPSRSLSPSKAKGGSPAPGTVGWVRPADDIIYRPGHRSTRSASPPGAASTRSAAHSSRNAVVTDRQANTTRITTSPSGRFHPNLRRRFELRGADMHTNIDYFSPNGAPDNDRKMKESSWLSSQAWFEALRYYPQGQEAVDNGDSVAAYSGLTHGADVPSEHLETDLRTRLGIASADPGWSPSQLPVPWGEEKPQMQRRLDRLKSRLLGAKDRVKRQP